mmetsp:Transcript_39200/g.126795  ORF Transcript_39200/g.126795 Transcript_39200/m.126795 type:complete len:515 (+) Transcript_39200:2054-3598(+)
MPARLEHAQRLTHKVDVGRALVERPVADEQVGARVGALPRPAQRLLLRGDERRALRRAQPRLEGLGDADALAADDEQRNRGEGGLRGAAAALVEESERLRRRGRDRLVARRSPAAARRARLGALGRPAVARRRAFDRRERDAVRIGRAGADGVARRLLLAERGGAQLGIVVILGEALRHRVPVQDVRDPRPHLHRRRQRLGARDDAREELGLQPRKGRHRDEAVDVADDRRVRHVGHPHRLVQPLAAPGRGRHQRLDARRRREVAGADDDRVRLERGGRAVVRDGHVRRVAAAEVAGVARDAPIADALEEPFGHDHAPAERPSILARIDDAPVERARRPQLGRQARGVLGVLLPHRVADARVARGEPRRLAALPLRAEARAPARQRAREAPVLPLALALLGDDLGRRDEGYRRAPAVLRQILRDLDRARAVAKHDHVLPLVRDRPEVGVRVRHIAAEARERLLDLRGHVRRPEGADGPRDIARDPHGARVGHRRPHALGLVEAHADDLRAELDA